MLETEGRWDMEESGKMEARKKREELRVRKAERGWEMLNAREGTERYKTEYVCSLLLRVISKNMCGLHAL